MDEVTYVVDKDVTDRAEAATVCDAVLDAVNSRLASATVDAYSHYVLRFPCRRCQLVSNNFATFHDCGYSVVVDLSDEDASAIRSRLSPIAPVLPLSVVHARRRAERRAARREPFHRVRSRLHDLLRR